MTKERENTWRAPVRHSGFVIVSTFVIRASSFVAGNTTRMVAQINNRFQAFDRKLLFPVTDEIGKKSQNVDLVQLHSRTARLQLRQGEKIICEQAEPF